MRTFVLGAVAVGLLLAGSSRAPAQDAKAILDKALKAHGGLEKINKYKAAQTQVKGRVEVAGGIDFTQEASVQAPDKIKEVMHLTVMGQQQDVTTVYNGKQGWIHVGGMTVDMPAPVLEAVKDAVELMGIMRLAFAGGKEEATLLGESKVNDHTVIGVKISRKDRKDVNLYFDKESGLLTKVEHRTKDAMTGQEVDEERIITEYQDKEGMKVAKKAVVNRAGKKYLEIEVTDVKLLEKLDDSEFDKP